MVGTGIVAVAVSVTVGVDEGGAVAITTTVTTGGVTLADAICNSDAGAHAIASAKRIIASQTRFISHLFLLLPFDFLLAAHRVPRQSNYAATISRRTAGLSACVGTRSQLPDSATTAMVLPSISKNSTL